MEDQFLQIAEQAALEAGKIIAQRFGKEHQYNFKDGDLSDFATQADLLAEEKIVKILAENFPSHNIIAEEKNKLKNDSEYTWVIDPLDGTISFAVGMPYFAVSVALLKDNLPILGVIYHVAQNDLYWAQKGKGAYLNGQALAVSSKKDLTGAVVAMDFGHKKKRLPKIDLYIMPLLKQAGYIYSIGSSVMCLGLVAKGIQDAAVAQAWIWDFAAGAIIIAEAGGKVTDLEGNEPDWTKERLSVVASNGLIHDAILEALK